MHYVIHKSLYGFPKGRSCLTNLLSFKIVCEEVDYDENYDIMYVCFSKAFDRASNGGVLDKKKRVNGRVGKICNWIRVVQVHEAKTST